MRPGCVLVYESGTIGAKPTTLPLSIGDGELAETADAVVSVPEMFAYWLQGGRIDVGFLGAAQIDRYANLNSTVIGDYATPKVRLPGGGGAPEIATSVSEVFVMLRQSPRAFVEQLDFKTSRGDRVRVVVTDLGILELRDGELELVRVHPGVSVDQALRGDGLGAAGRTGRRRDGAAFARRARRSPRPPDERAGVSGRVADRAAGRSLVRRRGAGRLPRLSLDAACAPRSVRSSRCPRSCILPVGPCSAAETVSELDYDLTRQHDGEPLGERIIVSGRVLDEDGRPMRNTLVEVWQANAGGRYKHEVDQHPAPLDPNFSGAGRCLTDDDGNYRFITVKPGAYPWGNHENAWRPAHIHFSVFGRAFTQRLVTQMYFPGDPLFRFDPIFNSIRNPTARALLVSEFDLDDTKPDWALAYRWNIVLGRGGNGTTPIEEGH